jgi:hypothetical protein
MMSVKMPTPTILLEKPKRLYEDQFVFTYEYRWFEFEPPINSKKNEVQQVTNDSLCKPADCSWGNIAFSFTVNQQPGVSG